MIDFKYFDKVSEAIQELERFKFIEHKLRDKLYIKLLENVKERIDDEMEELS